MNLRDTDSIRKGRQGKLLRGGDHKGFGSDNRKYFLAECVTPCNTQLMYGMGVFSGKPLRRKDTHFPELASVPG